MRRVAIANLSVFEIKSVVDDARAESIGRITVGFTIWETSVVPMLLANSEVFTDIKKKTIKLLEKIQLKYLRLVLGVGTSCPIPIMMYHTGTLSMSNKILLRKICFLNHISTLPTGTLARDVYDTMVMHNYDGLAKELAPFLEELGVTDIQSYSKYQIKKIAKQKILEKQKTELLTQAQRYKK